MWSNIVIDMFIDVIANQPKMEYFRLFKTSFQYENYLECLTNKSRKNTRLDLDLVHIVLKLKLGDILVL